MTAVGPRRLTRIATALGILLFDVWAMDSWYGRRRCERRGGEPEMRGAVVVCWMHPAKYRASKSLEDAGWLGRALHAWRMRR
jgi:hypothetical protein